MLIIIYWCITAHDMGLTHTHTHTGFVRFSFAFPLIGVCGFGCILQIVIEFFSVIFLIED